MNNHPHTNINYVALLPNGQEFYCSSDRPADADDHVRLCMEAVRFYRRKGATGGLPDVKVFLFELVAREGQLMWKRVYKCWLRPPEPGSRGLWSICRPIRGVCR